MNVQLSKIGRVFRKAVGLEAASTAIDRTPILSGPPAQIIQSTFEQAFRVLGPKHIQLLVEESTSGRMFIWHSEEKQESGVVVHSEEFDHSCADPYWQLMPGGDWILQRKDAHHALLMLETGGKRLTLRENMPAVFSESFSAYRTVISVVIDLGDEWQGRFVMSDPSLEQSNRRVLDILKKFAQDSARSIHAAHLCLRACRDTAAEERARLARELHDGTIQSLLGVELRLESFKQRTDLPSEIRDNMGEVQGILRREAMGLRNLVNDSRRRALRPERLLEFLSDLLERFQRDSGMVTRFFADLDNDPMPPRICHEIARMAEEGIANAHRHSRASTLTVRIGCVAGNWVLVIVDDGIGFDFRGVWSLERLVTTGLGPRVIKERVQLLEGDLMIESTPTGARIEISVPKRSKSIGRFQLTSTKKLRHDDTYADSTR